MIEGPQPLAGWGPSSFMGEKVTIPKGAMTFTDMAADPLLRTTDKDKTPEQIEQEKRDAANGTCRWAKATFGSKEERREEAWHILEVLGLDREPFIPSR
jgi:hypothetical protein